MLRRINLSAALIGLVCFFLPWVQVSCAGAKDTLSGLDLARNGQTLLWLVPILLGGLALLEIFRGLKEKLTIYSIVSALCGGVTVYLNESRAFASSRRVESDRGATDGLVLAGTIFVSGHRDLRVFALHSRKAISPGRRIDITGRGIA